MATPAAAMTTTVAIVGGGPAGMMAALLLARAGVAVTLVEAHRDFERDFRGDMIHPSTLEVLSQLGLVDRLHQLPHAKLRTLRFVAGGAVYEMANFGRLPTPYPYVMVMPQVRFLDFLLEEARRYSTFRLVPGAAVRSLCDRDGIVTGVVCRGPAFHGTVEATLTIGADGRFSQVRRQAALTATVQSRPMEVVWCRLPRRAGDPADLAALHFAPGRVVVLIAREPDWQVGCVVTPGRFSTLKAEGLAGLRRLIGDVIPWLADRVGDLRDWADVNVLRIEADRVVSWHRPGLLLIGDAAHAMLPVGGVGSNCAVADAVEAANVLTRPLLNQHLDWSALAEVQRRRERITATVQRFQRMQQRVLGRALASAGHARLPLPLRVGLRVPGMRDIPARIIGFGVRRPRLEQPALGS